MGPSYLTVIVSIPDGNVETLRAHLKNTIDPQHDAANQRLVCHPSMPFHQIGSLHFASILILDRWPDSAARLVFEATFDGSRDAFLADLVRTCQPGLAAIFKRCDGYPSTGLNVPSIFIDYLKTYDIGAHLMYRGTPGRTVSQIVREAELRRQLQTRARAQHTPTSFRDTQSLIENSVIRSNPELAWSEDRYEAPREVQNGLAMLAYKLLPLLITLLCLWLALFYWGFAAFADWLAGSEVFQQPFASMKSAYEAMKADCVPNTGAQPTICQTVALAVGYPAVALPPYIFALIALAFAVRTLQHASTKIRLNPFAQDHGSSVVFHMLGVLRYSLIIIIPLIAAVALFDIPPREACGTVSTANVIARVIATHTRPRECVVGIIPDVTGFETVSVFVLLATLLGVLWYLQVGLNIRRAFERDIGVIDRLDEAMHDILRISLLVLGGVAVAVLVGRFFEWTGLPWLGGIQHTFFLHLLTAVLILALGVIFVLGCWHLLLRWVHRRPPPKGEAYEAPSMLLLSKGANARAYAREDRGNNWRQNNLTSVTWIKPGLWNYYSLRITLWVINLLARYYYNKGTLGDIPTILSARWALIDKGKQLIFLDHYAGAWDSYLGEFIDMGAVKGVNAIWTNTFLKVRDPKSSAIRHVEFPKTSHIFWKGAQDDKPFKAYVRQSQIETLVWYSAYPDLDVVAINAGTTLRTSLFENSSLDATDAIVQDI